MIFYFLSKAFDMQNLFLSRYNTILTLFLSIKDHVFGVTEKKLAIVNQNAACNLQMQNLKIMYIIIMKRGYKNNKLKNCILWFFQAYTANLLLSSIDMMMPNHPTQKEITSKHVKYIHAYC